MVTVPPNRFIEPCILTRAAKHLPGALLGALLTD
jgi:hypothetical protein